MTDMKIGAVKAPKRRKIASLDKRKERAGWFFVLPFLIGFVCVYLPIITDSVWLAFNELTILPEGYVLTFVGLENFSDALTKDPQFVQVLLSGLGELAFQVPAILLFSLFMAVLLNQKMAGRAAFRAIFFLPVILATGIMESIEISNILGSSLGDSAGIDDGSGGNASGGIVSALDVEALFANMKVGTELVGYVVGIINDIYSIVNRSGVQMLIFLSGLQSISPSIYESCQMEGATAWETFWKITFPMISPMILVNAFYTIIDSFTAESNEVMQAIINISPDGVPSGLQSAAAWTYFAVVIIALGLVAIIASKFVFYNRKGE